MSARDRAWRGLAAFVFAVCGGALWLGGAGSLQAAQRIEALSQGRGAPAPFVCSFRQRTGHPCLGCGGTEAFGEASRLSIRRIRPSIFETAFCATTTTSCGSSRIRSTTIVARSAPSASSGRPCTGRSEIMRPR